MFFCQRLKVNHDKLKFIKKNLDRTIVQKKFRKGKKEQKFYDYITKREKMYLKRIIVRKKKKNESKTLKNS